jgi:glycosyltransferase involved in cell wall biosynthesis
MVTQGLLQAGHEVKVLCIATHKHPFKPEEMPSGYRASTDIEAIFVDTRVNVIDALSNFITSDSYNISRFFSPDMDLRLNQLLKRGKFDLVILESLFMTPYIGTIRRFSKARIVLRSHNLEYVIWERMAGGTKNVARKTYLNYLARKLKDTELQVMTQVDGIASISAEDTRHYRKLGVKIPLVTVPFGLNLEEYNFQVPHSGHGLDLFHIGSMDWSPNIEGIVWFLEDSWPEIHAKHPEVRFTIAGRNMPAHLLDSEYPGVKVLGEVENAKQFITSNDIMVVPLLSAGGMRVKIIEAMALGRVVISTTIGAEGIPCTHEKDILIASNPAQFALYVEKLLQSSSFLSELSFAGRGLVETHFDNKILIAKLVSFYESLLDK